MISFIVDLGIRRNISVKKGGREKRQPNRIKKFREVIRISIAHNDKIISSNRSKKKPQWITIHDF